MASATLREEQPRGIPLTADLIRAHPVLAFFVLAYLLSWTYWLVVLGIMRHDTLAWFVPGAFGPPIAALAVTVHVDGRQGCRAFLKRLLMWRVKAGWYFVALIGLPALGLVTGVPFRNGTEPITGWSPAMIVSYLAAFSFLVVLGGGQEEPGWRGFALPRMQERMGPLRASLALGVLWGLWHLPVFVFVPGYHSSGTGAASVAVSALIFTAIDAVGQSLLLTWLFNHTHGSILFAVLAHASLNAGQLFVATGRSASIAVSASFAIVGLVLIVATRGRLAYRPPELGRSALPTQVDDKG